ncbi:MAG: sulfate ABC transporter substrate-binding protein [Anaerolineae bacterium]|nr:sulfate ABC transporter substrate-binding protein [Anaerolineae bacterium]
MMRRSFLLTILLGALLTGCQPVVQQTYGSDRHSLVVYSFSVEEEALIEGVFPAFTTYWRAQADQQVTFQGTFTGSEEVAAAVMDGAPADVAFLSNEQHALWLNINGWLETDWHALPNRGVVTCSPIVIVVRPGNPLAIHDWSDLARPGVEVIHPDPAASGGAQWALLAEYGSALLAENGSEAAAREQLRGIWQNVVSIPQSSRDAMNAFIFGEGDALVTYEQDALLAQSRGADLQVVIPARTILSEHVVVVIDRNVSAREREVVDAFVAFLWSETAQQAFTRFYFRSVTDAALNEAVPAFAPLEGAFTAADLGGWSQAYPEIIRGVWEEVRP